MTTYPSADLVARVLIAACRETDFPVLRLPEVLGPKGPGRQRGILPWHFGRPRALAALALSAMFPGVPALAIARMVGARKKDYLKNIKDVIRAEKRGGFDAEALQRVIEVGRYVLPARAEPAPTEPAAPANGHPAPIKLRAEPAIAMLPPIPGSKQALRDQLAEAVRNTAKIRN